MIPEWMLLMDMSAEERASYQRSKEWHEALDRAQSAFQDATRRQYPSPKRLSSATRRENPAPHRARPAKHRH